jgi:hypothetical protein
VFSLHHATGQGHQAQNSLGRNATRAALGFSGNSTGFAVGLSRFPLPTFPQAPKCYPLLLAERCSRKKGGDPWLTRQKRTPFFSFRSPFFLNGLPWFFPIISFLLVFSFTHQLPPILVAWVCWPKSTSVPGSRPIIPFCGTITASNPATNPPHFPVAHVDVTLRRAQVPSAGSGQAAWPICR